MVANRRRHKRAIYTIGFTQKTLRQFVTLLREAEVDGVVDIRQNNTSQLAGFAKRDDLAFILETQGIGYLEEKRLAPTLDLLKRYHARARRIRTREETRRTDPRRTDGLRLDR